MVLLDALMSSPAEPGRKVVREFEPWSDKDGNQLLFFLKPEITALGAAADRALDAAEVALSDWGCSIDGVALLGPTYLQTHHLIERHYGLINLYSTAGSTALSEVAIDATRAWLAKLDYDDVELLGAHEYLRRAPELSSSRLLELQQSASHTMKVAGGAYASVLDPGDGPVAVINGFHPAQLDHFYTASAPILVATIRTQSNWKALRRDMIGATNPSSAAEGSLRRQFLDEAVDLGLPAIDGMRNGVHLSAGPVEAAVEVLRYILEAPDSPEPAPTNTNLGALLGQQLGAARTDQLLANPDIAAEGQSGSVFDLTEEMNTGDALSLLSRARIG